MSTGAELLSGYDLPPDIYDEVAGRLKCKCGEEINLDDPYVTEEDVNRWYGESAKVIIKTFGINRSDAENFIRFLTEYPMMGLDHHVGKRILDIVQQREIPGIAKIKMGDTFYRSRIRTVLERPYPYLSEELQAPPNGVSKHGRYNPVGVSVLYLADSTKTSVLEIDLKYGDKSVADVAKVVALEDLEVWDVRKLDIGDFISMPSLNNNIVSKEYILPNFLSQCCSFAKLNGILYESVKNRRGYNLSLFNYELGYSIALFKCMEQVTKKDIVICKKIPRKMKKVLAPDFDIVDF